MQDIAIPIHQDPLAKLLAILLASQQQTDDSAESYDLSLTDDRGENLPARAIDSTISVSQLFAMLITKRSKPTSDTASTPFALASKREFKRWSESRRIFLSAQECRL
jgi:hypothetical protein